MTSFAEQITSRGFSELPKIECPSKELISIASMITPFLQEEVEVKTMTKKTILKESQNFLLKYFNLYNVPYERKINLLAFNLDAYGSINPFSLPVKKVPDTDIFYGCSREVLLFESQAQTCSSLRYRWIELSNHLTELAPLAYTHEIIHTQLNHVKGAIKEYNNIEFLSIFLELIEALESPNRYLIRAHDFYRLRELKDIINELAQNYDSSSSEIQDILLEGTSYLHSTLKAYHLFDVYVSGNIDVRRKIMVGIQRVLNHSMSIEELLTYFNITYENSIQKEIFQRQLRRI